MSKREIRLSGFGGQGLILSGTLLGEAVSIYDGKEATQTQSYGPEARGGASRSEVIISDGEIDYPKVRSADILLSMSQESYDKYISTLKEDGILIIDTYYVKDVRPRDGPTFKIPITQIAIEKTGKKIVANVVALGLISAITKVVSYEALEKTILTRAPKGTEELNLTALKEGYKIGIEMLEKENKKGEQAAI